MSYAMLGVVERKIHTLWRLIYNAMIDRPMGCIYTFHMVCPNQDYLGEMDKIRVSPEYFEKFLIEKKEQVEFISIEELPERIKTQRRGQKPFGVITFDDGYEDNFIYAYPILKKMHIPFVIYVSINLVNDHSPIWNYPSIIERIIQKNEQLVLGNGETYICRTAEEKDETFRRLRLVLLGIPYEKLQTEFEDLFGDYLTEDVFLKNTLTWKQIEELAKDSLCTIGCHTMSHCRLTITDKEYLSYELGNSKKILEQHVGKTIKHMAYPYGGISDVSEEAKQYTENIGYKTALHSIGGPIRKKNHDMYSLMRVPVFEK